jgi:uncharacterized Fe-S cluster-containing radical SAM superfamily protein
MVEKEPLFCALAFGSASVNSYGEYIPCCSIRTDKWKPCKQSDPKILELEPKDRINAPNLREVRRSLLEGEFPPACENCEIAETAGVNSMRNVWNNSLTDYDIPMEEYVDPDNIRFLDLTFSTKCNSKCMTCNADLSDFWEEEDSFIWNKKIVSRNRVCIPDETAHKLAEQFSNVVRINFVGGEPTIAEEHVTFLRHLVAIDRSKDIVIGYVTNLTGMNTELIKLWREFKEIGGSVSIDGLGIVNEYIRYPVKWQKTDTNLRRYLQLLINDRQGFMVGLSCTVSLFNAIQCVDLMEYWIDTLTEYDLHPEVGVGIFLNRVSHPEYLTVNLLSPEYRQLGIDKAYKLLDKIDLYNKTHAHPVDSASRQAVELLISWLSEPQIKDDAKLKKCKHFITYSDKFRKRELKDYIPELWEELEKLWNSLT